MTIALATVVALAIAAPHLLPLERVRPALAAGIWMSALALRALAVVFVAIFVVFFVRATELFGLITHWCWHAVIPFLATHLALNGHDLADAATIAPAFVLAVSLLSVAVGLRRAGRSIGVLLRRNAVGAGPRGSVIVGSPEVMLAAAGVKRPKILVSAGALATLDDEELAAGLDHERAHIARHHGSVFFAAELFRALARFVPGTRTALRELRFHLERDADQWALRHRNDPLVLASAICKAAGAVPAASSVTASLGGGASTRRVEQLLENRQRSSARRQVPVAALAVVMVGLVLSLTAMIPATTAAGVRQLGADNSVHHCVR